MEYCTSLSCFQYAPADGKFCDHCRDGISWWDPHFHVWTVEHKEGKQSASGHDASILSGAYEGTTYNCTHYEADMDSVKGFRHTGGAFVEATSCGFPDTTGELIDYVTEREWVGSELSKSSRVYVLVCGASLEASNANEVLTSHSRNPLVRGIRQVVNYKPSWPRNDKTGNLLTNPNFISGFSLLAQHQLSFDLQLNPHQYLEAAELVSNHPSIPVIIDHLGTPTLEDLQQRPELYWKGMSALAACPNTFIKISMLCYIAVNWDQEPLVVETVQQVIKLFGAARCMFASNFPVDRNAKHNWSAPRLLAAFLKLSAHLPIAEQQQLWRGTAHRAYQIV